MLVLSVLVTCDAVDTYSDDYRPDEPVIGDPPPDIYGCRDEAMVCDFMVMHEPGFCTLEEHQAYVKTACRQTCGYCHILPYTITHETNLVWAQKPMALPFARSNARLMSIPGNPRQWMSLSKPTVKNIAAPHFSWGFQALGFHWEDQLLFWSEGTNKKIQSVILNGSLETTTLFTGSSAEVHGIAVDWLSRNLYFTDGLYNWIMMTSTVPNKPGYRIIVQDGLESPHGLAVHPSRGRLFWSDWGTRAKIESSDLLGENRKVLLDTDMVKPLGLVIDYDKNRLYWVDSFKCTIEMADLNGKGHKILHVNEGSGFFGIAVYGDYLFVTDRKHGRLEIYTPQARVKGFGLSAEPFGIIMYDNSTQPGTSSLCTDLNCEQLCVLDPIKGARCLCGEGYNPVDSGSKACKASQKFVHPSHFYAIGDSVCHYPANMADMSLENLTLSTQCFLGDKQHTPGYMTLTFDAAENMLYLYSNASKSILRLPLELGAKATAIEGGTGEVRGMSLDWISGNLYWTDATHRAIMVSKKNGKYQRVVLDRLASPVGIAVHPIRGKMFWTDHGHLPMVGASVEKANLDGSNRERIMAGHVWQPNHLFIDFKTDSLYWTDSMKHHVRKQDLETGRITVIYEDEEVKFYGLSVFNDFLIWTDTENLNGVHMARLDKKEKVRGIIHPNVGIASDLITFDPRNQPEASNACAENVTECFQLCLLSEQQIPKCYCSLGYTLSDDGFTCYTSPTQNNFLLLIDAYQQKIFQMNLSPTMVQAVDLEITKAAIAIDYDPTTTKIYWSDTVTREIREATIEGKLEKAVMLFNSSGLSDGIAVDYINRLLFFTDTGNKLIGVLNMDKESVYKYIIEENLEQPRAIVVSPSKGYIYWSDWGDQSPGIERANMDGSNRTIMYKPSHKRAWINGIALDSNEEVLYWVDAAEDTVNSIDLVTNDTKMLHKETRAHFFSIDVIGQYLYLSDWMRRYIMRMPKTGGDLVPFGVRNYSRIHGIRGYSQAEAFKGVSVCASSKCEHLCLPKEGGLYTCQCAEGYETSDEGLTCNMMATTTTIVSILTTTRNTKKPPISLLPFSTSTSSSSSFTSSTPPFLSTNVSSSLLPSTNAPPKTTLTITKLPVTMGTTKTRSGEDGIDVVVTFMPSDNGDSTTIVPSSRGNTTVARSTSPGKRAGLSSFAVAAIVCCVIIVLIVIIIIIARRKNYLYKIAHGKLVEDKTPTSYYQIAFNGRGDNVTLDSGGGIENPTYDFLTQSKDEETAETQ